MISFSESLSPCKSRVTLFYPFHCPSSLSPRAPYLERAEQQIPLVTLLFTPAVGVGDGHGGDEMLMERVAPAPLD